MTEAIATTTPERAEELLAELGPDTLREMLETMWMIRAFEEKAKDLYALGKIHGTMHLSIGQEGSAVGTSYALRPGHDYLLNHHRGHGHVLAWGRMQNLERTMAEFMGKQTGFCRGRGGSMHIADVESNNLGANGIVGGGIPIAAGVGLSTSLRGTDQVGIVMFGDGAANEGAFHESLNMASIWDLPVIYYCENNQYAMSMSVKRAFNIERISERACAYGIVGVSIDGNDALAAYDAVKQAVARARRGEGPTLIESVTYRWEGHSKSDRQAYRTREELKEWQARDPIPNFGRRLIKAGILTQDDFNDIHDRMYAAVDAAVEFAENSPEPNVANIMDGVYA